MYGIILFFFDRDSSIFQKKVVCVFLRVCAQYILILKLHQHNLILLKISLFYLTGKKCGVFRQIMCLSQVRMNECHQDKIRGLNMTGMMRDFNQFSARVLLN